MREKHCQLEEFIKGNIIQLLNMMDIRQPRKSIRDSNRTDV